MDIKIGCDPEFFVKKDGQYVSAFGLINGTKYSPQLVDKGAIQVDGMALEFNIDPATTADEFADNIQTVLKQFREIIPAEYEFAFDPVAQFGSEYIQQQPFEAKVLGCTPDFNAYTGEPNPKPDGEMPFRTASGHIHIGWTEDVDPYDPEHMEACCMLVKELDVTLGCLEKFWDGDTIRKNLYGAYGAFRPKPYGLEYRVLSNAWLRDPDLMKFVFHITKRAFDRLLKGKSTFHEKASKFVESSYRYDYEYLVLSLKPYCTPKMLELFNRRYKQLRDEAEEKRLKEMRELAASLTISPDRSKDVNKSVWTQAYQWGIHDVPQSSPVVKTYKVKTTKGKNTNPHLSPTIAGYQH